jgi:hypothetical protein
MGIENRWMLGKRLCCGVSKAGSIVWQDACEVFLPYPSDRVGGVVLILREPEFAFLSNNIEDLLTG